MNILLSPETPTGKITSDARRIKIASYGLKSTDLYAGGWQEHAMSVEVPLTVRSLITATRTMAILQRWLCLGASLRLKMADCLSTLCFSTLKAARMPSLRLLSRALGSGFR